MNWDLEKYVDPKKFISRWNCNDVHYVISYLFFEFSSVFYDYINHISYTNYSSENLRIKDINERLKRINYYLVEIWWFIRYNEFNSLPANILFTKDSLLERLKIIYDKRTISHNIQITNSSLFSNNMNNNELDSFSNIFSLIRSNSLIESWTLHGSYATEDFISWWSDVDILLIISSEKILESDIINLKESVSDIWHEFKKIDKIQLHWPFLLLSEFMQFYNQSFFPLILFNLSKNITGYNTLMFSTKDDFYERRFILFGLLGFFQRMIEIDNPDAILQKIFMHRVFSMPMFFLQTISNYTYKKISFIEIKKYLEPNEIEFFQDMTRIMQLSTVDHSFWNLSHEFQYYANFAHRCLLNLISQIDE